MKKNLFCLLFVVGFLPLVYGQDLPKPMNPPRLVNDFTHLLTSQEEDALERKLRNYHDTTSNQVYIVTTADLQGYDIADYSFKLGRAWEIGQKDKSNGILILIVPKNGNHKGEVFIATGYGLEGAVPDALCKRIVEQVILPAFREGRYYNGLDEATTVIIKLASGEFTADDIEGGSGSALFGLLVLVILILVLVFVSRRNGGDHFDSGSQPRSLGFPFFGGMAGGSFGGFSSGSGGFGGFGGGGGGSFGGGGAGGSW